MSDGLYTLDQSVIARWGNWSNRWVPVAVDVRCPRCHRLVMFELGGFSHERTTNTVGATAVCPGCRDSVRFWVVEPLEVGNNDREKRCLVLAMYPPPDSPRQPIKGAEKMPERLQRAYHSAVKSYNDQNWESTAVGCGRTLEGIIAGLSPDKPRQQLAEMLRNLADNPQPLTQPVLKLCESVRQGRNVAAHFDLETDPDRDMASTMIELIESLIEYVYVLPAIAEQFQSRVGKGTAAGVDAG